METANRPDLFTTSVVRDPCVRDTKRMADLRLIDVKELMGIPHDPLSASSAVTTQTPAVSRLILRRIAVAGGFEYGQCHEISLLGAVVYYCALDGDQVSAMTEIRRQIHVAKIHEAVAVSHRFGTEEMIGFVEEGQSHS